MAQDPASAQAPGQLSFSHDVVNPQIKPAERAPLIAKGKALLDSLTSTPALAQPRGFALNSSLRIDFYRDAVKRDGDPFPVGGQLLLRKIDLKQNAKADAQGRYPGWGEGPAIQFRLNDLLSLYERNAAAEAGADSVFSLTASLRREAAGLYRLQSGLRQLIVIADAERQPFVHLSREDYLRRLMKELYPDGVDPSPKPGKGLAKLQAELEALSAEQRAAPACTGGSGRGWTSGCDDPSSVYQVRPNPDYFDRSRPRHSVQLITLVVPQPWVGEDREEGDRLRAAAAQLDLDALRKLLG